MFVPCVAGSSCVQYMKFFLGWETESASAWRALRAFRDAVSSLRAELRKLGRATTLVSACVKSRAKYEREVKRRRQPRRELDIYAEIAPSLRVPAQIRTPTGKERGHVDKIHEPERGARTLVGGVVQVCLCFVLLPVWFVLGHQSPRASTIEKPGRKNTIVLSNPEFSCSLHQQRFDYATLATIFLAICFRAASGFHPRRDRYRMPVV